MGLRKCGEVASISREGGTAAGRTVGWWGEGGAAGTSTCVDLRPVTASPAAAAIKICAVKIGGTGLSRSTGSTLGKGKSFLLS